MAVELTLVSYTDNIELLCNTYSMYFKISIASCSLGAAWASIEFATEYLKDRIAFGRPLSDQQVSNKSNCTTSLLSLSL